MVVVCSNVWRPRVPMAEMIRDFFAESKQQMEQWREAKPGSSHMSDQNRGSLLFFWGNIRLSYEPPDIWWLLNKRLFQNTYEPTRIPWNVTSAKELKSRSRGYASMDYRIIDYRTAKGRALVCWQPVNLKEIQQILCKQKWCGQNYRTDTQFIPGHTAQMCTTVTTLMQSKWSLQGLTTWWNWRPGSSVGEKITIHIRKLRSPTVLQSYNPYRDPIKNHYKKFIICSYTPTESTTYITTITTPTKTIFW